MGYILNPNNYEYQEYAIVKNPSFYVDKTEFIAHLNQNIQSDDKFICFSRPRRFGKTITAKMLSAYYSKGCDSKELFDRFKIASDPSYIEHLNKYNVIYIDMNGIYEDFLHFDKTERIQDVVDYLSSIVIRELRSEKRFLEAIKDDPTLNDKNLARTISEINRLTEEQFVFIMDEWDLIYREFGDNDALQRKFIDLLRGLFKNTYCQQAFALVYLTGILPIKKYNSESALNNFREFNMLQPEPYEKFFGFTEEEAEQVAKEHNNNPKFTDLKKWYDGYKLNGVGILNPNSVACAINSGKCRNYWTQTASFAPLLWLIERNIGGFKEDLLTLLAKGRITFKITTFQNDMVNIKNKDDAFCLLVCLGYVACKETTKPNMLEAYIPNLEISLALTDVVFAEDWFPQMEIVKRSEELYKATITKDGNRVAEIMNNIHNGPHVSALTYNSEAALSFCVLFGYTWSTYNTYNTFRELDSGKGFIDIAYVPLDSQNPVLIIELKYDVTTDAALTQIRNQKYAKDLASRYPNVLLVAINYNSKTKEHECVIENY